MIPAHIPEILFEQLAVRWGVTWRDRSDAGAIGIGRREDALVRRERLILILDIEFMLSDRIDPADMGTWLRTVHPAIGCRRPLDHVVGSISDLRRLHSLVAAETRS